MTDARRPVLLPAEVPWQASASYEFASIAASEESAEVTIVAFFGRLAAEEETRTLEAAGETDDARYNMAGFARVVIGFGGLAGLCLRPSLGSGALVDRERFDAGRLATAGPAAGAWLPGQACPDPRFYRVEASDWLAAMRGVGKDAHHWLILGHSAVLEVAALRMSWRKAEDTNGS